MTRDHARLNRYRRWYLDQGVLPTHLKTPGCRKGVHVQRPDALSCQRCGEDPT